MTCKYCAAIYKGIHKGLSERTLNPVDDYRIIKEAAHLAHEGMEDDGWIMIGERLPCPDQEVLILTQRGNYWIAEISEDNAVFFDPRCPDELCPDICKSTEVREWQPLPPPPDND